ncbi:MAG: hypothetical protein AVDCRST_MAG89-1763 [uncultured Gemmatimonadetes bacterium]|uniref:Uncharacterized protein n=1 Tax=uncultured Gemmatimonadota bacterium TaxID=203437 RepID=A0A6J4LA67_9BACT|nr:MAG: hypothetical protein AVDCRST_MAG89-1763 [uncultured Gemmatimonadota bacterium]
MDSAVKGTLAGPAPGRAARAAAGRAGHAGQRFRVQPCEQLSENEPEA